MNESLPPLPTEEAYRVQAQRLDSLMTTPASIGRTATKLAGRANVYNTHTFELGRIMSPHDRTALMAFSTGSMAGLVLARLVHDPIVNESNITHALVRQNFSTGVFERGSSRRAHLVTGQVADAAARGLSYMGEPAQEAIKTWAERTMPDEAMQQRFRQGIGLAALLAHELHANLLYRDLRQRAQNLRGFDWDAAKERLLS